MGTELLHEHPGLQTQLAQGPLLQGLQARTLLSPRHLLTVGGVGQGGDLTPGLVNLPTQAVAGLQGLVTLGLSGGSPGGGLLHAGTGHGGSIMSQITNLGGGAQPGQASSLGTGGLGTGLTLPTGRGAQGLRPPPTAALTLLSGAQRQAGLGLASPCLPGGVGGALAA